MTTTPAAHPAKDLLIAIAMGQQMECNHASFAWAQCTGEQALEAIHKGLAANIRIAPGQPGYVTRPPYPQGLTVMPEDQADYFVVDVDSITLTTWAGYRADISAFNAGLCYPATPEGEAHAREAWHARFGGERG